MIYENENQINQRRSRITNPTPYSGLGKLAPQSTDLEEVVLGALMIEKQNDVIVWTMVKPEIFYRDNHQKICKAIVSLRNENVAIDILTVVAKLRKQGELEQIGGAYYITELTSRVASGANIEFHLRIIYQNYIKRELIRIGTEMINNSYEDTKDIFDIMPSTITEINQLEKGIFKMVDKDADELSAETIAEMKRPKLKGLLGKSTGLKGLDHVIRGHQKGTMVVINGPTSSGKTAVVCSMIKNCCFDADNKLLEKQIPVGLFSLEMPTLQLTPRLISNISSISSLKIQTNDLTIDEETRLEHYWELFNKAKIRIDDSAGLSITEFENKAAIWVAIHGIELIVIDYLQLMNGDPKVKYGTREERVSDISRRIKKCAKDLGITIIALSQVDEQAKKRALCLPMLGDVKECKAIENDADTVISIWRPSYFSELLAELKEKQAVIDCHLFPGVGIDDFENVLFLIVLKNRSGELGKVPMKYDFKIMRIYDHYKVLDAINSMNNGQFETDTQERPVNF